LPWGRRPAGEGRIVHVDHFGNLISDLPAAEAGAAIAIAGRQLQLHRTYVDVAPSSREITPGLSIARAASTSR